MSIDLSDSRRGTVAVLAAAALVASAGASAEPACSASSAGVVAPVVELYTSEGCSSCPPADRWLSALKSDPAVVALAFHVDYWDRLGWKDRFASPAFTDRQSRQQASNGARFSYTPQVVLDGRDRPDWPQLPSRAAARPPASVDIVLTREGERVVAAVAARPGAPRQLAAFWAVTEQGHVSAVKAGENDGATLRHDFVVREYQPVAAWAGAGGAAETLRFRPAGAADAAHPRTVNLVVADAATGRPVQAAKLGC